MSNSATAKQTGSKTANEVVNAEVDFSGLLDTGESLTGTVTLTSTPAGLTFDNTAITTTSMTINGRTVAAGQAVTFRVTGGTGGTSYEVGILCGTDSTPAQTREAFVPMVVLDT